MECQRHIKNTHKQRDHRSQHVQTHRPKLRKMPCFDVTLHEATGLHNGIFDKVDVPDPYVELHCQQTVEKHRKTAVKWNNRNPEFNETMTFTQITDKPVIDIIVKEKNTFVDAVHGKYTGDPQQTPNVINLYKNANLRVDVSCKMQSPTLRAGMELCQEELDFRRQRLPVVHKALEKLLGQKMPAPERLPTIAVLGSGGGFRAMMGMSGVYKALVDTGLLDCVTYAAGLSGSSWYLCALCSHPDWPRVHPSVVDDHLNQCVRKSLWDTIMNLQTVRDSYNEKQKSDRPWTFTDLFGHWVGHTIIPDRMHCKWSDQQDKVRDGRCPLPLLSCVHAEVNKSVKQFHDWVEISPFEVYMPRYATSLKTETLGSEFYKGKMVVKKDELPLHYLMGICGSAYTALHKSFSEMAAKSKKLSRSSRGSEGDRNTSEAVDKDISVWIDYVKRILNSFGMNYLDDRSGRAAKVHNFMHQLTLEEIGEDKTPVDSPDGVFTNIQEKMSTEDKYMCLIDAGLAFNSPYPLILRPDRQVDLILSFEFSDRGKDDNQPFKQLLLAKQWADCHKVPFPPINIKQYEGKPVQELYVFQDEADLNCPIILHFVLVNNDFRYQYKTGTKQTDEEKEFADFSVFDGDTYDSIKFEFTETEFLRISKLMEFNVHHSIDIVKETILKAVDRRQHNTTLSS
ncbi:cytosolic phospholipase A2-like [Ylistrum balloti]|uniref:cytosolic phospholipase A2-like n=1 Tax=Ylistrum balloti TaxID=509963 RepID=UPI002905D682|nr:cytosolic phospholipase A2-like [Ylistrum balloti]